jgi:hypothetical protein
VTVPLVFTSRERKAVNRNYFNAFLWKPAIVAADVIPQRVPGEQYAASREHGYHALRHTYASVLLAAGVDVRTLADFLGHGDPGLTLRVYTHLMPSAPGKARRAVDRALGEAIDGSSDVPVLYQGVWKVHNPRSAACQIRRRSTWRTRAGSAAGEPGRPRWPACSRPRWR